MERITKLRNENKLDSSKSYQFDVKRLKEVDKENSTYMEVLRIFKEAFDLIDINKIFNKIK